MGILDRGSSFVFNGGTTGWGWGLANDAIVQRITLNLIERLADDKPQYPERVSCQAYPNPAGRSVVFRILGHTLPEQLHLYSNNGRRVATVPVSPIAPRAGYAVWDYRDDSGRHLPSGIYFARGDAGRATVITHVR